MLVEVADPRLMSGNAETAEAAVPIGDVFDQLTYALEAMWSSLERADTFNEVELRFGINLSAGGSAVISRGYEEANILIIVKWSRDWADCRKGIRDSEEFCDD